MNIRVLIPSEEYRAYAGARIRYGRLAAELQECGIALTLQDIGEFAPEHETTDALLISKCHDARALVAAAAAYQRGQLVGVDLFDDYFSQTGDSRLVRYRNWLKQLLGTAHFALCSTPALAEVVEAFRPSLPVHVVNDPAVDLRMDDIAQLLASKLATTRNELTIRLAWFGVGDNPHFKVGLSDLAAYSDMLHRLTRSGFDVELSVLTNARALTAENLAMIGQLPVRTQVHEWTEQREKELLADAFACFLPVNAQRFSSAKSLNRAVTALSGACQVISAGHPLYATLGDLIYRDPDKFLSDLARGSMQHSSAGIGRFQATVDAVASPSAEAAKIAEFLADLDPSPLGDAGPVALVHGYATSGAAHKSVRALKGLSVASPYCAAKLNFDVIFRAADARLLMLMSDHAAKLLPPSVRKTLEPVRSNKDHKLWVVPKAGNPDAELAYEDAKWHSKPLPFQLATYQRTMTEIGERLQGLFGPCRLFLSESSPLPFSFSYQ
jgi:hypothetical protein